MNSIHAIDLIVSAFELTGVSILVIGSLSAFIRSVVSFIRFRDGPAAYRHLRLYLYLPMHVLSLTVATC